MKVNISEKDRTKYIYRFISIDILYELIETGKNTFVRPKLWEDPYENFLFQKGIAFAPKNKINTDDLINGVFGQCWTNKRESDFS